MIPFTHSYHWLRRSLPLLLYAVAIGLLLVAIFVETDPPIQRELILIQDASGSTRFANPDTPTVDLRGLRSQADRVINILTAARSVVATDQQQLSVDATDLASGIQLAAQLPRTGRVRRRAILLSDGRSTQGDAELAAATAADRLLLETVAYGARPVRDALVRTVEMPTTFQPADTARLRVWVAARPASPVRLLLEDDRGTVLQQKQVAATAQGMWVSLAQPVPGPGLHHWHVQVSMHDDQVPENDRLDLPILVRGGRRALWVGGTPPEIDGFEMQSVTPAQLTPMMMQEASVIVLENVPATALPPQAPLLLQQALERGIGLLVIGGPQSLGLGGYEATGDAGLSLGSLLPMRVLPRDDLALAVALDTSGSMGEEVPGALIRQTRLQAAAQALRETVATLGPGDDLAVIRFARQAAVLLPATEIETLAPVQARIGEESARLLAGGGTSLFAGIDAALAEIESVQARKKHIILITDGDTLEKEQTREAALRNTCNALDAAGVGLSIIAVGEAPDRPLLQSLTADRGTLVEAHADLLILPRILARTLQENRNTEMGADAQIQHVTPHPITHGLAVSALPVLQKYDRVGPLREARAGAQVLLADAAGHILAASGNYGFGRVAVLTGRMATDWGWSDPRILHNALRWCAGRLDGGAVMQARVRGESLLVDVRYDRAQATRMQLLIGGREAGDLYPVAPDTWHLDLPAPQAGEYMLSARTDAGDIIAESVLRIEPRAEWLMFGSDGAALSRIARAGGGRLINNARQCQAWEAVPVQETGYKNTSPAIWLGLAIGFFLAGLLSSAIRS